MLANSLDSQKVNIGSHVGVGPTAPGLRSASLEKLRKLIIKLDVAAG